MSPLAETPAIRATQATDYSELVRAGREHEEIDVVYSPKGVAGDSETNSPTKAALPDIQHAPDELQKEIILPEVLVEGVIHRGSKGILGGGSKSFKTWCLLDLGLSVSQGVPWWGKQTTAGRVLYLNLELASPFFWERVKSIVAAKRLPSTEGFDAWNLRGFAADAFKLMPEIIDRVESEGTDYSLIIVDPIYKVLGGREENNAGDVAEMLNLLEKVAVRTGAAVFFGHHFTKGNQSQKEAIDRVSGSGAFARDPDTILMMTAHEEPEAFTVECILRNFPPTEPFVVRREHPLMVRDDDLDPSKLKEAVGRNGAKSTVEDVLQLVPEEGAIQKNLVIDQLPCGANKARGLIDRAVSDHGVHAWSFDRQKFLSWVPEPASNAGKQRLIAGR